MLLRPYDDSLQPERGRLPELHVAHPGGDSLALLLRVDHGRLGKEEDAHILPDTGWLLVHPRWSCQQHHMASGKGVVCVSIYINGKTFSL